MQQTIDIFFQQNKIINYFLSKKKKETHKTFLGKSTIRGIIYLEKEYDKRD